ncbi:MAG: nitroreductase family protein, partial [Planctomycetes bacterium]|nr:nitroreductase family protein [Planctomycetota bacterium]
GILVAGDVNLEKYHNFWVQDCSAATQNILLAAHSQGLGAVWCGVHPVEEREKNLQHLLNMLENVKPFSIIAIGVPADGKGSSDRYQKSRVHHNTW